MSVANVILLTRVAQLIDVVGLEALAKVFVAAAVCGAASVPAFDFFKCLNAKYETFDAHFRVNEASR